MAQLTFSICVCTYNRSAYLYRFLDSVVTKQVLSGHTDMELLIIDNNSTDNTKQIIESFADKLPIKYLFEQKQGLSNARNCALKNAKGEWVIFTDDDVLLSSLWFFEYRQAIKTFPNVEYLGGRIKPYWRTGKPVWLKDDKLALLSGVFGHYDLGQENLRYQKHHPAPYGGNFAISRELVKKIGQFNINLGVKARNSGRGEETEYFKRSVDAGFQGVYVAKAACFHEVDTSRFCTKYMYKHGIQKGLAHAITEPDLFINVSLVSELTFLLKGVWQLMKGRRDRYYQCIINFGLLRGLRMAQADKE